MTACHAGVAPFLPTIEPVSSVLLVGNPNVGKSAIFGALTGRYANVSNYPGTTVEVTSGNLRNGQTRVVIDTPGIYSFVPLSDDERVTRDILLGDCPDVVAQVVDAKNLRRGLLITLELCETGLPVVVSLNMVDEARSRGIVVHPDRLSALLDLPVVTTIATRGEGVNDLIDGLDQARIGAFSIKYPAAIEAAILAIAAIVPATGLKARGLALMFLAGAEDLPQHLRLPAAEQAALQQIRQDAEQAVGAPLALVITEQRLAAIDTITANVVERIPAQPAFSTRLGRWAVHPFWGWPILAAVLVAVYWVVGVVGAGYLVDLLDNGLFGRFINPALVALVDAIVPFPLVRDFLVGDYGLLTVALTYSIAIVLPIVGCFFVIFGVLEDSGYLPRLAVMLDRGFRMVGLNGKAVLPMVLGLGCGTMATVATRVLETRRERIQATLLLALGVPCSAQLGVLLGMVGSLGLVALAIWGGVVLTILLVVGYLAARVLPGKSSDFILELPPLRWPMPGPILLKTVVRLEWYFKEVLPIFVLGTSVLFVLYTVGALAWLEAILAPLVVHWLGLPTEATAALLVGFLRRDYGSVGLFDLHRNGLLNPSQVLISIVVLTLFVPCMANLFMIAKEHGMRTAVVVMATVFPLAIMVGGLLNIVLN